MPADVSQIIALSADLGRASLKTVALAQKVVAKTAHDIEATAKGLAPVDTGAMRNSISATIGGLTAEIGPTTHYSPYVEFGTSRMAPQPFMGPAADAHEAAFMAAMEAIADQALG